MRRLADLCVAAGLLAGCALSNDIGFLLTGRAKDISWRNMATASPSSPDPGADLVPGAPDLERLRLLDAMSAFWILVLAIRRPEQTGPRQGP
jgi:hypothetical protein